MKYILNSWPDFYYFKGIFLSVKKILMGTLYLGRRGSQKVYGLYTHESVDIYGRPINDL